MKLNHLAPSYIFLIIYLLVNFLPSIFIVLFEYQENLRIDASSKTYAQGSLVNFYCSFIALIFFCLGCFFISTRPAMPVLVSVKRIVLLEEKSLITLVRFFLYVSVFILFIYIVRNGFGKVFNLGGHLTMSEFRLSDSFDSISRFDKALLQVERRLILPFFMVYSMVLHFIRSGSRVEYYLSAVVLLCSVIITLDRGPLMMVLVLPFFVKLHFVDSVSRFILVRTPWFIILVVTFGGLMTFLQHNVLDIEFDELFYSGFYFLWHRIFADPSIAAIELVYIPFDSVNSYLWLSYSRLSVIWGGEYIGTTFSDSIYVSPVGFVADIWRNMGFLGVAFVSMLVGMIFRYFDKISRFLTSEILVAFNFTVLTLSFYLTNGVFFSQGVFLQFSFLLLVGFMFSRRRRR